jgi:hypothetical protein
MPRFIFCFEQDCERTVCVHDPVKTSDAASQAMTTSYEASASVSRSDREVSRDYIMHNFIDGDHLYGPTPAQTHRDRQIDLIVSVPDVWRTPHNHLLSNLFTTDTTTGGTETIHPHHH